MMWHPSGKACSRSSGSRVTGNSWSSGAWPMSAGSVRGRSLPDTKRSIKQFHPVSMCGIAGIIDLKGRVVDGGMVRRMTKAIAHRGPDADGLFVEGSAGLGHRRLSIIDLSAESNQPFYDPSGRYVMVYNGEMYNYEAVKAMMPDYAFRTSGDTEVLLAAYIRWGADCLRHFRGMYAFVIWDKQEKTAFLCRDKMGVKPLYVAEAGDRVVWWSEVGAIVSRE